MTRVKRGTVTKKRHKRLLKQTKGFWGQRKNVFKQASDTLLRALAFATKGRD
ncbi:MAG: 50S ribosomal protein L20 [Candidatus Dependentiae bacterium]|nr:50S ribosomal protein L20 [Candidatus Dependentiae bacterium]